MPSFSPQCGTARPRRATPVNRRSRFCQNRTAWPEVRRHFAREIATGVAKLKSLAGNRIVAAMLGRDGGLTDGLTQAKLLMLFAETRMGWKETVADEHANEDRRPFIIKFSKTDAKL